MSYENIFVFILGLLVLPEVLFGAELKVKVYNDTGLIVFLEQDGKRYYCEDDSSNGEYLFKNLSLGKYELFVEPGGESWSSECIFYTKIRIDKNNVEYFLSIPDRELAISLKYSDIPAYRENLAIAKFEKMTDGKIDPHYRQWLFFKKKGDVWSDELSYADPGIYKLTFLRKNPEEPEKYIVIKIFKKNSKLVLNVESSNLSKDEDK